MKPCGQWSRPSSRLICGVRAEFADAEHDRLVEQVALGQIRQQRRKRRVERLGQLAMTFVIVHVRIPAAERHFDAAHAGFDQPPGGQAAAAERSVAVRFARAPPARWPRRRP